MPSDREQDRTRHHREKCPFCGRKTDPDRWERHIKTHEPGRRNENWAEFKDDSIWKTLSLSLRTGIVALAAVLFVLIVDTGIQYANSALPYLLAGAA